MVDRDIDGLGDLAIEDVRDLFANLYGTATPPRLGKDLMIRAIAYRIQEQAQGGLTPAPRRRISKLSRELAETGRITVENGPSIKPGTRLIREWQGNTHEVTVTDDGYLYRDRPYRSLSRIAREITGTRWSGPTFFGLTKRNRKI